VVETRQSLELGLRKFMFELSEGKVHVVGTKKCTETRINHKRKGLR